MKILFATALMIALSACGGENCKGNEGASLQTACAFYSSGHKYEQVPKACGLPYETDSTTVSWVGAHGKCTCKMTREFPTMFYAVGECTFKPT